MADSQRLDIDKLKKELVNKTFIEHIIYLNETHSTNEYVKQIQGDNVLVLAEFQKVGRGRFDRQWYSEKQKNLLISIKKKLDLEKGKESFLTFTITNAIHKTVEDILNSKHPMVEFKVNIKWPNDILVNFKKISGILIEHNLKKNVYFIGIGLNVNQTNFLNFDDSITSFKLIDELEWDRNEILIHFINTLNKMFLLLDVGRYNEIYNYYLDNCALIGNTIEFYDSNSRLNTGTFEKVLENGKLLLKTQNGICSYSSGEIKLKLLK